MTALVAFHSGQSPDHAGRFIDQIQCWPDAQLESVHDFIQWLFPLPEPSPVNPAAPVLDAETMRAFHSRPELRAALRRSLERMLQFYGFELAADGCVTPGPQFASRSRNWMTPGNHNHLRITRILRACRLLGLETESTGFFEALSQLYGTIHGRAAITQTTFRYWTEAAAASVSSGSTESFRMERNPR